MKKITAAVIGAGSRGLDAYAVYGENHPEALEIVAVAEPRRERREAFAARFKLPEEKVFDDWEALLDASRLADMVFICTQDTMHVDPAVRAMEKGYHILLEKPVAVSEEGCRVLLEASQKYDVSVAVAHVLRYTPFFSTIKRILDSGVIGDIQGIQHNENVGHIHYSHSYIRGNLRNREESSPMILAKSCHDTDILLYLTGRPCTRISSFGSRRVFLSDNRPEGAPDRCLDGCPYSSDCPYFAPKIYLIGNTGWPVNVLTTDLSPEGIETALREGPYGRCVYACDNDVVEHQTLNLELEGGLSAVFTMSAFTSETTRTIKVLCSGGEIRGHMEKGEIQLYDFRKNSVENIPLESTFMPNASGGGHCGGDEGMVREFLLHLNDRSRPLSSALEYAIPSHMMALAADEARLTGRVVEMASFYRKAGWQS